MKLRLYFLSASFAVLGAMLISLVFAYKLGVPIWPKGAMPFATVVAIAWAQLRALTAEDRRPAMPRAIGVADLYPPKGRP